VQSTVTNAPYVRVKVGIFRCAGEIIIAFSGRTRYHFLALQIRHPRAREHLLALTAAKLKYTSEAVYKTDSPQ